MLLFAATAVKPDDEPTAAFLIARNPDEAAGRATDRLQSQFNGGKITHLVAICPATPGQLQRNGLAKFLPPSDQVEFVATSLLDIIGIMSQEVALLKQAYMTIFARAEELGLRHFGFLIVEPNGTEQPHSLFAENQRHAMTQALELVQTQYPGGRVANLQEIANE